MAVIAQAGRIYRPASRPRAAAASQIGKLCLLFVLFLFMEGVIRKWLFNSYEKPFILIRDPIVLAIYATYLRSNLGGKSRPWMSYFLLSAALMVILACVQVFAESSSFSVMIIGLRGYILYIPLAFILSEALTEEDMRRIIRMLLIASVPIALLVYLQYRAPPSSPLNQGTSDDVKTVFQVAFGIVRPYGPFTFVQAQSTFSVFMVAITFIAWLGRVRFRLSMPLLVVATLSTIVMGALSGSRTFFGGAILIILCYALGGMLVGKGSERLKRPLMLIFASLLFIAIFMLAFPKAFSAMRERQTVAEKSEGSTVNRGFSQITEVFPAIGDAPLLGYGMGAGSNAGSYVISGASRQSWTLGEYEWPRIVEELGPLAGLIFIGFRMMLAMLIGYRSLNAYRNGDASALILFGFSGYVLLVGQVVGQNQMLSFCWLSVGLTMALVRLSDQGRKPSKAPAMRMRD